jgi:hypothetical protein
LASLQQLGRPLNPRIDKQETPNIDPGSTATLKVTFAKHGNRNERRAEGHTSPAILSRRVAEESQVGAA